MQPERWNEVRARRRLREDVPPDDLEINRAKAERIRNAFAALRRKMEEVNPDVVVVFGDDQLECFDFSNFPSFAIYVGEEFDGLLSGKDLDYARLVTGKQYPKGKLHGHPELAVTLLTGVMKHGFDPAFSLDMPKPEHGFGHAFLRPAESITDMKTPVVPVLLNCYYAPQLTAKRSYELGKAIRTVLEDDPGDLRVAVVGSGGLWHTPGADGAYLNEEFDQTILSFLESGDARAMAEYFDSYVIPEGDTSQSLREKGRGATGMPSSGGPQGGTRETCNWIAAAAVADGSRSTVVDYVPVYASPVGAAFTYCDKV
jgi:hypothetical protein